MAQFVFKANITDKHGNPLIGVEVEAINVNDFTPALADPIQHVVATATTDISGTATFTGLDPGMYYARPRLTRPDLRIQVMVPSGMGGGGKMCYAAFVHPTPGIGTHTTIQSAITALGTAGGLVWVCSGTYQENLVVAGDTEDLWLVGAGRGEVLIQGTAASPTITVDAVGTGRVTRFRLEHLTIDHTGAQTLIYFNSVAGGVPTQVDLLDLRLVSGSVGIDLSDTNGGTRFTLRDIIIESTVTDAGQLEVINLIITNVKIFCVGKGLYLSGPTASTGIRVSDSHFGGGDTYALRIGVSNDVQISNSRIVAVGAGTMGIRIDHVGEVNLDNLILDIADGVGIDATSIGSAITISDCKLSCTVSQSTPRVGIVISGSCTDVVLADNRIKNFESFGIQLETLVPGGAQHFVIDGNIIVNNADTHSISIAGWDFGTITGNVLVGTGGGNTTYGIYGGAGTTYVVITGNTSEGHDGLTNLTNGVDNNVIGGNTGDGTGLGPNPHDPVTLDANADSLLSLSTQELGLDTQAANLVFAGPDAGDAAVPTFRSLVDADIPAAIMRDQEHTDIGDAAPHHAAVTLAGGSDPILTLAGQELTLGDVATQAELNAHAGDDDAHHALVTLAADAEVLLGLTGQQITLDSQTENTVLAGPVAAPAADPTFRALVTADIPDLSATYLTPAAHTAIGDGAPHHARLHAITDVLDHSATNWRMFYSDGSAHIIELALGADGTFLQSGGAGTLPEFTALVAGDIPDISATYIALAFMAAKGDLISASGDNTPLILSVGADGHVLTADSTTPTGLKWAAGGAGGVQTLIEDADQDTKVQCEEGADEDKIRFDTAGTERMQIDENGFMGISATPSANFGVDIRKIPAMDGPDQAIVYIATTGVTPQAAANNAVLNALAGIATCENTDDYTGVTLRALRFQYGLGVAAAQGAKSIATGTGVSVKAYLAAMSGSSGTIDLVQGVHVDAPFVYGTAAFTTVVGLDISDLTANLNACTDVFGIRMSDFSVGTNRYFLELGDTPFLRLLANNEWTPAAGETPLYLAYSATPTLGQVKVGGAGGTKEIFLEPRPKTSTTPPWNALYYWGVLRPTDAHCLFFLWKVPPDFVSLNSVNVVMIPDTTETVQADLAVSVVAVGAAYNSDDRTLADQQLAVTQWELTEWDIKLGTIFDNIATDDYVAIRFCSDTTTLQVAGCRISYESSGAPAPTTGLYLD